MSYCKHIPVPPMPIDLKEEILGHVNRLVEQDVEFTRSYGSVVHDPGSDLYIHDYRQYIRQHGMPRPVSFWHLPEDLQTRVQQWLSDTELSERKWQIQYVRGGSSVAPHKDLATGRTHNIVYVLQPGGDNVTTTWWVADDDSIPEITAIPFERLTSVESHVLQEGHMYELTVRPIHSVSKFTSDRIMICSNIIKQ